MIPYMKAESQWMNHLPLGHVGLKKVVSQDKNLSLMESKERMKR